MIEESATEGRTDGVDFNLDARTENLIPLVDSHNRIAVAIDRAEGMDERGVRKKIALECFLLCSR